MKIQQSLPKWSLRLFHSILLIIIPLLLYAAVLIFGIPKEIALDARYNFLTILIIIALLLFPAYCLPGLIGGVTSLSSTLILFALPLSALWFSGASEEPIIGGILPFSDAGGYYLDASQLLEGNTFSAFASRRPLFPGMLAALLKLTQQNLQITLAILVAITAISCFFLAREVQRSHGVLAGLLAIIIPFLFYRPFIGITMTENLGLALGLLGFAILWFGARQRQINHCLLGLFLLSLALNARAGAFFILPAIILWGAWSFREQSRFSKHFLIAGSSMSLLAFILNFILLKTICSPGEMAFSNFSYTLYGLIVGGNWTQVLTDHPELNSLSDPELSQRIYALAFEAIRAKPLGLVKGAFRAWQEFLFNNVAFSFIGNLTVNKLLQILSLIGLFACYRNRSQSEYSLILIATFGLLISVPFIPPWDVDLMRVYAPTMPFFAILPVMGLELIAKGVKLHQPFILAPQSNSSQSLLIFSVILAAFVCVSPIITKVISRKPQFYEISCPAGMEAVYFRPNSQASLNLVADNSSRQTYVPNVRLSDFKAGMAYFPPVSPYSDIAKELTGLNASTTLVNFLSLKNGLYIWLIANTTKIPKQADLVGVCGKRTTNPVTKGYNFFYADSIQPVSVFGNKKRS